jgi:alpha-amylase/alpha-mannosidase (GH57 family)
VGRELIILAYCVRPSRYNNDYLTIQFLYEMDGDHHVVFTGSSVLSEQLKQYAEKLPFVAAIQKIGKYYSFV